MNEQNKDGFDTFITNEEFWRFLQALSNKQYFSTFEDISSTNKDSVLINDKEVNYDEKAFDFDCWFSKRLKSLLGWCLFLL